MTNEPRNRARSRRRLAAVLLCDLPELPELMGVDEAAALALVKHRDALLDTAVRRSGGTALKSAGGRFRAVFDSAVSAVESVALARELAEEYARRPGRLPMRLRSAVHLAELVLEGDDDAGELDAYGEGVELAESLLKLAPPGGLCVSREVYAVVKGKSALPLASCGTRELAGASEPCEVFSTPGAGAAAGSSLGEPPPPVSLAEPPPDDRPQQQKVRAPDPLDWARERPGEALPGEGGLGMHGFADEPERAAAREDEEPEPAAARAPSGPITDVVLSVGRRALLTERFGGLTVLERHLFTLYRAGARRVWVTAERPRSSRLREMRKPRDLEVLWQDAAGDAPTRARPPYATVSADHLLRLRRLRKILGARHEHPISYQDPLRQGDFDKKGIVSVMPYGSDTATAYAKRALAAEEFLLLQDIHTPAAMAWLLAEGRKSTDSFMAKHFDRRISLAVTRLLLDTAVKPNHMTVLSSAIGLAGALLLAGGTRPFLIAGALVIWLHSLLDGVDGELARLRFQESRLGGQIDFWGDNLVHFALFACLGAGLFRVSGDRACLLLGGVAAVSAVLSALAVYRFSIGKAGDGKPLFQGLEGAAGGRRGLAALVEKVEHALSQRDFLYLLVLLAALGHLKLFLWLAGIGTPLFLLVFLGLRLLAGLQKS